MVYYPYDFRHRLHMHHWHRRGPSRFVWFVLGATAASLFMKHKACHEYKVSHCMQHRIPPEAYPPPTTTTQAPSTATTTATQTSPGVGEGGEMQQQQHPRSSEDWHWRQRRWEWSWPPREGVHGHHPQTQGPAPGQNGQGQSGQGQGQTYPTVLPAKPEGWEDETQRLQRMTQQAAETVRLWRFVASAPLLTDVR